MLVGERRAAGGHGQGHAGTVEADDVGVALADDGRAGRDDRGLGPVEPVQHLGLVVERRLGRVLVLALVARALAAGQDAAAEADGVAPVVVDREQDAGPEVVVQPAPAVHAGEAGALAQSLSSRSARVRRVPGVGRPADLEVAHHVAVEPPLAQVAAGGAGVGARKEPLVVPGHGAGHGVDELGPPLAALALVAVGVAQGDPGLARQPLDRRGEVDLLLLHDEVEDVALGLAAEAVEDVLVGVDRERRGLLGVERAQPGPLPPDPPQRRVLGDDGHDVGRGPYRSDVLVVDAHRGEVTGGGARA